MLEKIDTSAAEIRSHLLDLAQERAAAEDAGLDTDAAYMADLEAEVLAYRVALVGAQLTDIAGLRGALYGRNLG